MVHTARGYLPDLINPRAGGTDRFEGAAPGRVRPAVVTKTITSAGPRPGNCCCLDALRWPMSRRGCWILPSGKSFPLASALGETRTAFGAGNEKKLSNTTRRRTRPRAPIASCLHSIQVSIPKLAFGRRNCLQLPSEFPPPRQPSRAVVEEPARDRLALCPRRDGLAVPRQFRHQALCRSLSQRACATCACCHDPVDKRRSSGQPGLLRCEAQRTTSVRPVVVLAAGYTDPICSAATTSCT